MATPSVGSVVLFLASDPSEEGRVGALSGVQSWMARTFVPPNLVLGRALRPPAASEDRVGPFPADQIMCAQKVLDQAKKAGRAVQLVDVNRPGEARAQVLKFVGPGDLLPVLLRSDGARLAGADSFERKAIREFLARA